MWEEDTVQQLADWSLKWLNVAKKKVLETAQLMTKDFSELKEAAAHEVTELSTVAKEGVHTAVTNVAKQLEAENVAWMKEVVNTMSMKIQFLAGEKTYLGEEEFTEEIKKSADFLHLDGEEFQRWKESFVLGGHVKEIRETMETCPEIRKHYLEMVPAQMSSTDFWAKWFWWWNKKVIKSQPTGDDAEICSTQDDEDWVDWDD